VGGLPPLSSSPIDLERWAVTAELRPVPTSYELREISELLPAEQRNVLNAILNDFSIESGVALLDNSAVWNVQNEALSMRFGTTQNDGSPSSGFAESTFGNLRFSARMSLPKELASPEDAGVERPTTSVSITNPVPGTAYVASGLIRSSKTTNSVVPVENGLYYDMETDSGSRLSYTTNRHGTGPYQTGQAVESLLRELQGSLEFLATRAYIYWDYTQTSYHTLYIRTLSMITKTSGVHVVSTQESDALQAARTQAPRYANEVKDKTYMRVAWQALDGKWIAANHHSTRQPVTFIGSPTQLDSTTGNGVVAVGRQGGYSDFEFTRLYGRPAGYKLYNEGYGRFTVQFTNTTFQDAFSRGQIPTIVACPLNSKPSEADSLRPSDVILGNNTIDFTSKSASLRVRTLRFATNDGPSQLLKLPATMVGDSSLGFSLLAFYGVQSPNIKHAVITSQGVVSSGNFDGVSVTRLGTGTYTFDHPFEDTPACVTTLHASIDSTDRSACNPQISTRGKQVLVYCVSQGPQAYSVNGESVGSPNVLSLVDAQFSIVIVGVSFSQTAR